jgi:putative transposase
MTVGQTVVDTFIPVIHRLYCHIVWTTRGRERLIDAGLARFLCAFLRGVAGQERTQILEIGMVRTHVHLLVRLHPTTRLDRLLQRLKGGSAAIAGKERHSTEGHQLRWAKGYSIHSVSARSVAAVRDYLRAQPRRHPDAVIPGWSGDQPEYEVAGQDEWRSELRRRM